jgi:hypothetical protein
MRLLISIAAFGLSLGAVGAAQELSTPARLEAFAVLEAGTAIAPPANAPAYFRMSGRFAGEGNARNLEQGGGLLPMEAQPVQGVSAILAMPDGGIWALSDNGFGARANSADAMLMIHRLRPNWDDGNVARGATIFLSDPDEIAPFPIVAETARSRYLTGRDFDPESFAPRAGGGFWIGDEFGPYLLEVDARGRLVSLHAVVVQGEEVRSPDHWRGEAMRVGRSRGLEGMGHSADGRFLYPMLEAPLTDPASGLLEMITDQGAVRILQFDTVERRFTGREWLYALGDPGHAIGDITMLGSHAALVIERDSRQGAEARFKRIVRIDLPPDGGVAVVGASIDLLAIEDPEAIAGARSVGGRFAFPFVTIESLAVLPGDRILVVNDNNYPFTAARVGGQPDDTEMIILSAPALFTPPPP